MMQHHRNRARNRIQRLIIERLVAEAAAGVPEQLIDVIRLGCFIGRAA